jgi:hypothetical protein
MTVWTRIQAGWRDLAQKRTNLVEEYGFIAVGTLFALSLPIYIAFFWTRMQEGPITTAGDFFKTAGLAWAATRASLPLRIAAALVLTPFVAKILRRRPKPPTPKDDGVPSESVEPDPDSRAR